MTEIQHNKEIQRFGGGFLHPLKTGARGVIDLILPPRCAFSGQVVDAPGAVAPDEWAKLHFISDPQCTSCGCPFDFKMEVDMQCPSCLKTPPHFMTARSALVYNDQSRDLVLRFKHADQTHNVVTFLPWMMRAGAEMIEQADLIVPVPLHRWRLMKRRYNQAALIAQKIAVVCGTPWAHDILLRSRATPTQGHMKADQRKKNVRGAFEVPAMWAERIAGKTIVLVDDVYTTGATVNECAKVLLKAGAAAVHVLTLARVVKG